MRHFMFFILIFMTVLLSACQPPTPFPTVSTTKDVEFTLAPDQTATIEETGIKIRLIGVTGDQRCPSEIECAISGPVSISLSVQMDSGKSDHIYLQTFTSDDGRAPEIHFDGIEDRVVYEGYFIRVLGVLPYPTTISEKIKDSEFRVNLVVSKK